MLTKIIAERTMNVRTLSRKKDIQVLMRTSRAGDPATTLFAGKDRFTTEFAPMMQSSPMSIGPTIFDPGKIVTPSPIIG
jgi:hypothetical protein